MSLVAAYEALAADDVLSRIESVPGSRKNAVPPPAMLSVFAQNTIPVTIVCAPAGFGKTQALATLFNGARSAGVETAWLDGAESRRGSNPTEPPKRGRFLCVDNADSFAPRTIAGLVSSTVATGGKLFIAARNIDGLHLSRHLAAGDAQLLPPDLLLWRRGALADANDAKLTSRQVTQIERLAEGWAAPSMLMAHHLSHGGSLDQDGVGLTDSLVTTFIDEELLAPIDREWRRCLVALSLSEEFDRDLLERLSPECGPTIEALRARLGPLMVPTSHQSAWRLNHLLRQHLHLEFARLNKSARDVLRGIVTSWAADRGDLVAAATIMVQEGCRQEFLDLVARAGGVTLWLTKGYDHIRKLVQIADKAGIAGDARFQLLRCAALLKEGRIAEADALHDKATLSLPDTTEARRDAAFLQVTLLIYGCRDLSPEDAIAFRYLEDFALDEGWRTALPTTRAILHSQRGQFDAATAAILEAWNHCVADGIDYNLIFLDIHRAAISLAQGDLASARVVLRRARARWRRNYPSDPGLETAISALFAQLEFEAGKWRNLSAQLKASSSRVLGSEAWLDIYVAGLEPMFRIAAGQHSVAAAVAAIDRMRSQLSARGLDRVANILTGLRVALEGEAWLRTGALPNDGIAQKALPDVSDDRATWQELEFSTLSCAYRDLMAGEILSAIKRLSLLVDCARERNLKRSLLRTLLLRAAASDLLRDDAAASTDFDEALAIGEATGLRQAFAEFGGRYTEQQLAKHQKTSSFAQELFRNLRQAPPVGESSLTKRERQILEALGGGKSDKAIGRAFGITEHGVRFHLKNLYAKLGVHDREAAAAKVALLT